MIRLIQIILLTLQYISDFKFRMCSTLGVTRSYEKLSLPAVAMEDKILITCQLVNLLTGNMSETCDT